MGARERAGSNRQGREYSGEPGKEQGAGEGASILVIPK